MSVSNTISKAGPYSPNGAQTTFMFGFKAFSKYDLRVVLTTPDAVESELVVDSQFSVTLNTDQNAYPGGSITTPSPYTYGYLITIASNQIATQPINLTNFRPDVIEKAFDKLTLLVQQLSEQMSRTFKVPISSSTGTGNTVADYINQAKGAAINSAASASTSAIYAGQSSGFSASSSASAIAAANSAGAAAASAQAATTPTAVALAAYLDAFFPSSQMVTFASMYVLGGWDLGTIAAASPFSNEATNRRTSMSGGSGTFNFGTIP